MKANQGMNIISKGWIKKPENFRVRFQKLENGILETEYSPPLEEKGLTSDVTAWRYAWKLYMATRRHGREIEPEELVNLSVVNENDTPIIHYATGDLQIFNPKTLKGN